MTRNKFYYKVETLIPNITLLPINSLINELMNSFNYFINLQFIKYSYFEKGCLKKCTRQSRRVLWVVLSVLFFKEIWKNGTGGHGHMFASAKGKRQKYVLQLQSSGRVYWSYPISPFGIVACTFFPTTVLEIAVYFSLFWCSWQIIISLSIRPSYGGGGRGRRERKVLAFTPLPFSLPSFPFSPETPDTRAKLLSK